MQELATVVQLYLYPVKSMRGVVVEEAHVGFNGMYGDRRYAFVQRALAASDGFPWMTGREKPRMITYAPRFTRPVKPDDDDPPIVVQTPEGQDLQIQDPGLAERISQECGQPVFLFKSKRGNFDSQHLSIFSLASLRDLETESASPIDHRQFRANIYFEPTNNEPFIEDEWIGKVLRIGEYVVVGVTKKDSRCMMINLDPLTAKQNPSVLRTVVHLHDECAGIYANVVVPGHIVVGDTIRLEG